MLEALGFSRVEEQVYELLVSRGKLSLAEVQAVGDVVPERQRELWTTLSRRAWSAGWRALTRSSWWRLPSTPSRC